MTTNYFKLYKEVKSQLDMYVNLRGTAFGIGVKPVDRNDKYADLWQKYRMRLEILEAKLECRNPNWFFANYLDRSEQAIRNKYYIEILKPKK